MLNVTRSLLFIDIINSDEFIMYIHVFDDCCIAFIFMKHNIRN